MSKHTPGPWKFEILWAGFSAIRGRDGQLIFGVAAGDNSERRPKLEIEANARLIAAAPDLLEALRQMLAAFQCDMDSYADDPDAWQHEVWEAARAAIAKAKGKGQ